ncbi:MAG: NAD(P)/FAD-dependent oxidoreductase [Chromatiaceae bacterium]|nr:MAG: NAD(P)/FAD-dependent oxidoreductase [Chromatiaceae bacterium]
MPQPATPSTTTAPARRWQRGAESAPIASPCRAPTPLALGPVQQAQPCGPDQSAASTRILIIGGGFAGARLARVLSRRLPRADVRLLSLENYLTYNPLLAEVVGASVLPGHVVAPLRQLAPRVRVQQVRVTAIDSSARRVYYRDHGADGPIDSLPYDQLVLACGSRANLDLVPGMAAHALPLKTVGDALHLRNRIIARLEQSELATDPHQQRWLTSFVVVGGGFSGVEVAGEISDFLVAARRWYPRTGTRARVVLIHSGPHLLPELPPRLGRFTDLRLRRRGVETRLQTRCQAVDGQGVGLGDGERIAAGTVICTIGTRPNPLTEALPVPRARGRLQVGGDMSVPGLGGVWALGDCAAVPNAHGGQTCPPTAQFALRQAPLLAANITRTLRGEPTRPFAYHPRGLMAAIGHNRAVARVFGLNLSGFLPWLLWRGFYLLHVPTLGRKVRLYLEWNWAMFFPPDIAHLRFTRTGEDEESGHTQG